MVHLVIGLALAGLGVWGIVAWWDVFGLVMRGVVPFVLLVFGLVALLSGYRQSAQLRRGNSTHPEVQPGVEPNSPELRV